MKKKILLPTAMMLALSLSACSSSSKETTAAPAETTTEAETTIAAETTAEEITEVEEAYFDGTITKVDGDVITMKALDSDDEMTFDLINAETDNTFPLTEGDEIGITYAEGSTENPVAAMALQVYTSVLEANSDAVLDGTVVDATMNTVTIADEDGNNYTFATSNAYIVGKEGILTDQAAEVTYIGDLEDTDPIPMAAKVVMEDSLDSADAALNKFHGEVVGIDGNTIVVEAENGDMFTFTSDTLKFSSYSEGSSVEVEYTGSLTAKQITATKISEY